MRTISDRLVGAENSGEVVAVTSGGPIDLAQFRRDVSANAAALERLECRRGLLITEDSYWCAVGMLALFQIGAEVVLPQNVTAGACHAIGSQWDMLICDRLPEGHHDGFCLQVGEDPVPTLRPLDAARCRLSLFTSGSTGSPKRVEKCLAMMEREAAAIEAILGAFVSPRAAIRGMVTHQHLFGLSYKLFWPLCSARPFGGKVHDLWESLLAEDLNEAVIVASPAHLARLGMLRPPVGRGHPACLLSAGAELPESASAAAQRAFGAPLCEIYGSTETGTIGWRWRDRIDPLWQPAPGVAIRTEDDGTLSVASPFLSGKGVERTHDRADLTQGGFRLKGRNDRIVKVEGKRVSLPALEAALASLPFVDAAALVTLPGETATLGAVIVPSASGQVALAAQGSFRFSRQLRQLLAAEHELSALPRRWRFVAALPAGQLGKVRQADLQALFANAGPPNEPEIRAIRREGNRVELDLFNPSDLIQLDGHFPGMPIIPGVAQIDWAVKLAARHLDLPIEAATDYQVKFQRLTLPETFVTLTLVHDAARRRLSFSYQRDADVLTSGTIRLTAS